MADPFVVEVPYQEDNQQEFVVAVPSEVVALSALDHIVVDPFEAAFVVGASKKIRGTSQ